MTSVQDMVEPVLIGADPDPPCHLKFFRHRDGFRLQHDCTGEIDIRDAGRTILLRRAPAATDEAIATDLLGRVLAIAMHAGGDICLHASAVACQDGAIAFVAQKGTGKSTLAMALLQAGMRLLTDDSLRVLMTGAAVLANPGVHAARLRGDSADAVAGDRFAARAAFDGKLAFEELPAECRAMETVPLRAVYVLTPDAPDAGTAVSREQEAPLIAVQTLIAHGKLGVLLGGAEGGVNFGRLVELAARVPVYRLRVARDLARLPEVASQVAEWHPPMPAPIGLGTQ